MMIHRYQDTFIIYKFSGNGLELELPGMYTCNGLSEIICTECGMRAAPEVPARDMEQSGVSILSG